MTPGPTTVCVTGVLAMASGLVALLTSALSGQTRRPALWAIGAGVALALAAAVAWLASAENWAVSSAAGLSAAWFALAAMRSGGLEWAARLAAHPAGQAAMLLAAGLALVGWGLAGLDAVGNADEQLGPELARPEFGPPSGQAVTDAGMPVALFSPSESAEEQPPLAEGLFLQRQGLARFVIQSAPAGPGYNCHGWVFAGGRFWVADSAVPGILHDNGYRTVSRPRPGDLAVFTDHGATVTHSAVVRGWATNGAVLLESKWGVRGRYVHTAERHVYAGDKLTYYRTARGSHLLSGLPAPGSGMARATGTDLRR
jgi:hypothetical protein